MSSVFFVLCLCCVLGTGRSLPVVDLVGPLSCDILTPESRSLSGDSSTSALGALSQDRGSLGLVCLSFFSPLLLVRGPGVSHGWLVNRGFSPLLFDFFSLACFSVVLLVCCQWRPPTLDELSFSLFPVPLVLSLAFAGASSVCRFFLACECVLVTFSCWRCRVLCACFVVGVRGGLSFLSVVCLLNVCVQERRCSS